MAMLSSANEYRAKEAVNDARRTLKRALAEYRADATSERAIQLMASAVRESIDDLTRAGIALGLYAEGERP
jgi:hypothetical protein